MRKFKAVVLGVFAYLGLASAVAQEEASDPTILPLAQVEQIHPAWTNFQPEFTPYVCPFHTRSLKYDPDEFICGYVLVPEDRTNPDSRMIQLSVLQIKSTSDDPEAKAIVRLTGGPGAPSLAAGRIRAYQGEWATEFREAADLIFFDQRGIGYSEGHFCRAVPRNSQYGVASYPEGQQKLIENFRKCLSEAQEKGIPIDAYSTWQNALDVRDIRLALGYDEWVLLGVSYGTALGQAAINVDAEGVRGAILDSVVPATDPTGRTWNVAGGFRSSLNAMNAMCAADEACARDVGDMAARFIATFEAYDAEPMIIEDLDPGSFLEGRLVLDGTLAAAAVFQSLYNRSQFADFPSLLAVLESRDEKAMAAYAEQIGRSIDHRAGNGMEIVANCRGSAIESDETQAQAQIEEPVLSRLVSTVQWNELCNEAYKVDPDPSVKPLITDVPVLVGAGLVDPITPPSYSKSIMAGLANGQYVEVPYTGHGAFVSHFEGCGGDMMLAFAKAPLDPVDTSCTADITPPNFLTNLIETQEPYDFAVGLRDGAYPRGLIAAALVALLALIAFPIGWAAHKIEGRDALSLNGARPLAWLGAGVTLGGLYLTVSQILATATNNPMALPLGVYPSARYGLWIALIGLALAAFALYRGVRSGHFGRARIGTSIGLVSVFVASIFITVFLFSLGIGLF
ncbi:MAG: alpha/beta hydrolase [Pseudomonadota bacterium]